MHVFSEQNKIHLVYLTTFYQQSSSVDSPSKNELKKKILNRVNQRFSVDFDNIEKSFEEINDLLVFFIFI